MKFYRMDWEALCRLPTRVFWALNRQIRFVQAEENLRLLNLMRMAQPGVPQDVIRQFVRDQEMDLEQVMIPDYEAEAKIGRNKLRALAKLM